MEKKNSSSNQTFSEIGILILYIVLSPFLLGALFAKIATGFLNKIQINRKLKINLKQSHIKPILGILIFLICLAGAIFCTVWIAIKPHSIGFYVLWGVLIAVFWAAIIWFFVVLFLTQRRITQFAIKAKSKEFIEILAKPVKGSDKVKEGKNTLKFFTNYLLTARNIEKVINQEKTIKFSNEQLGVIINKARGIYVPNDILNRGTCVFGVTGGGKTNTLELFIKYGVFNRQNIIFVNGKGDRGLCEDLKVVAENNDYDFKCWSPQFNLQPNNRFVYNPFKDKDANAVTAMLMEIGRYSLLETTTPGAIYYKDNEMACINLIAKFLIYKNEHKDPDDQTDYSISLENLFKFADVSEIKKALNPLETKDLKQMDNEVKIKSFIDNHLDRYRKMRDRKINPSPEQLKWMRMEVWKAFNGKDFMGFENWCNSFDQLINMLEKSYQRYASVEKKWKDAIQTLTVSKKNNDDIYKNLWDDLDDVGNDDDKTKAMRQIKTTFRNLRNINPLSHKIISADGQSIREIVQSSKPTILLISLDTTGLKTQSSQIARAMISDLKQNMPAVREFNKDNNLLCIFDEFGSFATQDIAELQEQGRSYGLQTVYAMQTVSNLTQIGEDFATRLIGNCNTYIIHRMREDKGAEQVANIIGTNPAFEKTERESDGETTGERSVREVMEYIFHPREMRQLPDHTVLMTTVLEGKLLPIAGQVEVDYADIKNFVADRKDKQDPKSVEKPKNDVKSSIHGKPNMVTMKGLKFTPRKQ